MRAVSGLLWLLVLLAAGFSAVDLFFTMASAQGAPQQAAGAAMTAAQVIIPYVLARAVDELSGVNRPAAPKPAAAEPEKARAGETKAA